MKHFIVKASIMSFGIASILRIVSGRLNLGWFFYFLFPGVLADLYITGVHGSSAFEESCGFAACILVNTLAYSLILTALFSVWRSLPKRATRRPD